MPKTTTAVLEPLALTPSHDDDIPDPRVPENVLSMPTAAVIDASTVGMSITPSQFPHISGQDAAAPPDAWHAHEVLLLGFTQALQRKLHEGLLEDHSAITRTLDGVLAAMKGAIETLGTSHAQVVSQLSTALATLQERGLSVVQNPYQATVQAVSPEGYPVSIAIAKREGSELTTALTGLVGWMAQQGYAAGDRR